MGSLNISGKVLQALRVQGITLVLWTLGLRTHPGWHDVRQFPDVRHVAKVFSLTFWGQLWDGLLCARQWKWLGHACRSDTTEVAMAFLGRDVHVAVMQWSLRRIRTGTDNTSMRPAEKFLKDGGKDWTAASDCVSWSLLVLEYKRHWGVLVRQVGANVWMFPPDVMSWEFRTLQGTAYGSITVFMRWYSPGQVIQLSTLDREQGWVHQHVSVLDLVVDSAVFWFSWEWATKLGLLRFLARHTVHVRLFWDKVLIFYLMEGSCTLGTVLCSGIV